MLGGFDFVSSPRHPGGLRTVNTFSVVRTLILSVMIASPPDRGYIKDVQGMILSFRGMELPSGPYGLWTERATHP